MQQLTGAAPADGETGGFHRLRNFVADGDPLVFRVALLIAAVAVALRLGFWLYTDRVWEDALITVLHSENFGRGMGLSHFRKGEPLIHGFTSPISVLVPLLADVFRPGWGLILIRLLSAAAGGACVLMVFAINRRFAGLRLPLPMISAAAGYVAIEHHQMLWGMAGMETQLVVLVLLVALYASQLRNSPYAIGAALALCMYARPDFAFLVLIIGLWLLVRAWRDGAWAPLFKAAAVSALLYAPWIVFTTLYYGSPVPNTIHAKSGGYTYWITDVTLSDGARMALERLVIGLYGPQTPAFGGHGTGYQSFLGSGNLVMDWLPTIVALTFCAVGSLFALLKRQWDLLPIYGFLIVYTIYYVFFVPATAAPLLIFGWYTVPMNAILALMAMKGVSDAVRAAAGRRGDPSNGRRNSAMWAGALTYLCMFAAFLPITFKTERQIQTVIEWPVRKEIGLYLRAKKDRSLTVAGEPLGYIGYYSGLTYWDFPGLASRRVVAFLKQHPGAGLAGLMEGMRPDYLVLRRFELDLILNGPRSEWLRKGYLLERRFTVPEAERRKIRFVEKNIDTDFFLFRKRAQ